MVDEGPSSEDLERFGGETAPCPECGAEIWDEAEYCPECNALVAGETAERTSGERWIRQRWFGVIAILLIIGLLALFGFLRIR